MSLSVGIAALAVLVLGKKFLPNKPVALFVVVGGILASSLLSLEMHGVKLLGEVPQGRLVVGLPALHVSDLNELLPLALACFLLGAVISLVQLLHRASRPHVAVLGRIPGTQRFSDRERHSDNEPISGMLIFRPESGLLYFNVDHVRDVISDRVRAEATPPQLVVLDLSAVPWVDLQSAYTLAGLADELNAAGIRVQAVEARSSVRDRLRHEGVDAKLGGLNRVVTVADAVEAFQKQPMT